jgi:hypothetical protein
MPSKTAIRRLVNEVPLPVLLDPENEQRVFSHKSLFALPAHIQVAEDEPRDWERYACGLIDGLGSL